MKKLIFTLLVALVAQIGQMNCSAAEKTPPATIVITFAQWPRLAPPQAPPLCPPLLSQWPQVAPPSVPPLIASFCPPQVAFSPAPKMQVPPRQQWPQWPVPQWPVPQWPEMPSNV